MKYTKAVLFGLVLIAGGGADSYAQSLDGGGSDIGNGGGGWACLRVGRAPSVELVDHYEAREELRLNIPARLETAYSQIVDQLSQKIASIDPNFHQAFAAKLQIVRQRWNELPSSDLREFDDLLWTSKPRPEQTCIGGRVEYVQIVNFKNDGRVLVDQTWFNRLSPLDQALTQIHEAIYALKREPIANGGESAHDSRRTRELVGYLASDASVDRYRDLLRLPPRPPVVAPVSVLQEGQYVRLGGPDILGRTLRLQIYHLRRGLYKFRPSVTGPSAPDGIFLQNLLAYCNGGYCEVQFDPHYNQQLSHPFPTHVARLVVEPEEPLELRMTGRIYRGTRPERSDLLCPSYLDSMSCQFWNDVFGSGNEFFFRRERDNPQP